jgi:hypothetical protein
MANLRRPNEACRRRYSRPRRETLRSLAADCGVKLNELSRLLCRDGGYLTGFVWGRGPDRLRSIEDQLLAQFSQADPRLFGERED